MKQLFINLPVKDLKAAMLFYQAIGFIPNSIFSFDDQKSMVYSDSIYLMLQNYQMFQSGNKKILADSKTHSIVTFTLPVESKQILDEIVEKGLFAGGKETAPILDEGFMTVRVLEDPDGHQWGVIYLDMERFKKMKGK